MTLVVKEDVEGVVRLHHLVAEAHAVEPSRGEQDTLLDEGALEEVALLVLAAFAVTENEQGAGVVAAQLFQRGLELQALLSADLRRLPVSCKA